MVGTLTPFAIVLGGTMAVAILFYSAWRSLSATVTSFGSAFARQLDIADIKIKPEEVGFIVIAFSAICWTLLIIFLQPNPIAGALYLPIVLGFSAYAIKLFIGFRVRRRVNQYQSQLEVLLRSLASGVRVGLGFRQALIHVSEQSADPAKKELARVVGASNLGVSILDALDELAQRFPSAENAMLARVVRVNAQSGGDLGGVLDDLADTIRDRRRFDRRVSALTAQGRASSVVLGALPPGVFALVCMTQPALRDAVLNTAFGHMVLAVGLGLDALAVIVLLAITRVDA